MFETLSGTKASEAEKVDLYGQTPPIEKMDSTLSTLKACKYVLCLSHWWHAHTHAFLSRRCPCRGLARAIAFLVDRNTSLIALDD